MEQALRSGVSVFDFYQMTPREVYAVIDATNWRAEKEQQQAMSIAWLGAALQRAKKMPGLKSLLTKTAKPKKLIGKKLQERRREFKELATPEKLARINEAMRNRK
jgi:hypothetical protein